MILSASSSNRFSMQSWMYPWHATLHYEDETFEVILVPELTGEGEFTLKYYNAPAYDPETRFDESGRGTKRWSMSQAFGSHPKLEQAWLNSDPVDVQLHSSQLPLKRRLSPTLVTTILYAGIQNRGILGLHENRVELRGTLLKRAELSIVEFPAFVSLNRSWNAIAGLGTEERESLRSLARRLGDDAKISIQSPAHHVVLDSGDGWNIKLTRDGQQTRDMIGHTGLIERDDGAEFGTDELGELMEGLKYFFAFATGTYCFPTVIVGYDSEYRPVWGEVGRFASARHDLPNWFNNSGVRVGVALEELFPRFWDKWSGHKDAMTAVIECYVHSNEMHKTGVQKDAVAKSYAGMEILASLVLGKTIYGGSSEEICRVLSDFQIPHRRLDRAKTPAMARLCEDLDESKLRGSYLLGGVRNYVAHPLDPHTPAEVKEKYLRYLDADPVSYFYLYDLSQFYLEYALLKFFGYETADDNYRRLVETIQQV